VIDNKVGTFERDPKKIAEIVRDWFTSQRTELAKMAERAKALGRPEVRTALPSCVLCRTSA
jgi:UDP-N-acetylglucosamine:LPS N-acetylglucosamine transferase